MMLDILVRGATLADGRMNMDIAVQDGRVVHAAHLSSHAGMRDCFRLVTELPAKIMGLDGYGLAVGNPAEMMLLQAR